MAHRPHHAEDAEVERAEPVNRYKLLAAACGLVMLGGCVVDWARPPRVTFLVDEWWRGPRASQPKAPNPVTPSAANGSAAQPQGDQAK